MRGNLDEFILNLMDEIETTSTRLSELENELNQKSDETTAVEKQFATETARFERELAAAQKQRDELVARLDASHLNSIRQSPTSIRSGCSASRKRQLLGLRHDTDTVQPQRSQNSGMAHL
jgi:septal ring factor EnvC (AmiA/AmiB activator)